MIDQAVEIVCSLCSGRFSSADLDEEEILCQFCGHSLDDDHAASGNIIVSEEAIAQ